MVAALIWIACFGWSLSSAVGFALTSRLEASTERLASADIRDGWQAKIKRTEDLIAGLGEHRPSAVVRTQLSAVTVPAQIWIRTRRCTDVTIKSSRHACAVVARLRGEFATAQAAEQLETELAASRKKLDTLPLVSQSADPQAAALAGLLGTSENSIRLGLALLLAGLVEAGSSLGFTLISMASRTVATRDQTGQRLDAQPGALSTRRSGWSKTNEVVIERWVAERLIKKESAEIAARTTYEDYRTWSKHLGIGVCTETRFGIEFTRIVTALGGAKQKRRDRAYYVGMGLT